MGPGRVRARSSMRFWSCDCVIKYGKNLKISTIASRLNHNGGRSAPRAGSLQGVQHNLRSVALLRLQDGALLQRQMPNGALVRSQGRLQSVPSRGRLLRLRRAVWSCAHAPRRAVPHQKEVGESRGRVPKGALNPNYAMAHYKLGIVLSQNGDLEVAIASFQRALSLDLNEASVHYSLGYVLDQNGDLDGAISSYKQAISIDPTPTHTPTWTHRAEGERGPGRRHRLVPLLSSNVMLAPVTRCYTCSQVTARALVVPGLCGFPISVACGVERCRVVSLPRAVGDAGAIADPAAALVATAARCL